MSRSNFEFFLSLLLLSFHGVLLFIIFLLLCLCCHRFLMPPTSLLVDACDVLQLCLLFCRHLCRFLMSLWVSRKENNGEMNANAVIKNNNQPLTFYGLCPCFDMVTTTPLGAVPTMPKHGWRKQWRSNDDDNESNNVPTIIMIFLLLCCWQSDNTTRTAPAFDSKAGAV